MNIHSHHSPKVYQSNIVQKYFYNQKSPIVPSNSYFSKLGQFKKMQIENYYSPNTEKINIGSSQTNFTNNLFVYQEDSNNFYDSDPLAKSMINMYPVPERHSPALNSKKIDLTNFNFTNIGKNGQPSNIFKEKKTTKKSNEINNKDSNKINKVSKRVIIRNSQFLQYNESSKKYKLTDTSNNVKKLNNTYYYINKNHSNSNEHYQSQFDSSLNRNIQKEKKQVGNMAKLFNSIRTIHSSNSFIYKEKNNISINNTINNSSNSNNNIFRNNSNYINFKSNSHNNTLDTINNNINNNEINNDNKKYKIILRKLTPKNINIAAEVKNSEKNYMNNLVIRTIQGGDNYLSQTYVGKFHSYEKTPIINISSRNKKKDNDILYSLGSSNNFFKKINLDKLKGSFSLLNNKQNKKSLNMTVYNENENIKYKKPYINQNNSAFLPNSQILNMPPSGYENIKSETFKNENYLHYDEPKNIYKKPYLSNGIKLNEKSPKIYSKIYQKKQLKIGNIKHKTSTNSNNNSNDKLNFTTPLEENGECSDFTEILSFDRRESIIMSKIKNKYSFYEKKYGFNFKIPKSRNCYLTKNILKVLKKNVLPLKYISKFTLFALPATHKTKIQKKIYKKNYIKQDKIKNKHRKIIIRIIKRRKKKQKDNPIKYFTEQKKYIKTQNELLILNNKNSKNRENKNSDIIVNSKQQNNEKIMSIISEDLENYIEYKYNSLKSENYDWSITDQIIIKLKIKLPDIIYYYIQIAQNLIDTKEKMHFANSYIISILKNYIYNYINIHNFIKIHNEIVDLFEYLVRINDNNDDKNRLKYEVTGGIFYELLKNELFFVSDLNRFIVHDNNEELIINIVKIVKYIIISGRGNCNFFDEFNNSAIFKNNPIFFKYVTKYLKINNFENLIGKY